MLWQVENPEKYNFRPREMLHEVSVTILHFAHDPDFHDALVESGYYRDGRWVGPTTPAPPAYHYHAPRRLSLVATSLRQVGRSSGPGLPVLWW